MPQSLDHRAGIALSGIVVGCLLIAGCGKSETPAAKQTPSAETGAGGRGTRSEAPVTPNLKSQAAPPSAAQAKPKQLVIPPSKLTTHLPSLTADELSLMEDGHRQMVLSLRRLAVNAAEENPYVGDRALRRLRAMVNLLPSNPQAPPVLLQLYTGLGELSMQAGAEADSIRYFDMADSVAAKLGSGTSEEYLQLLFRAGMAHFRLGETQNCCRQMNPDSCILPLQGGAIHTRPEGSRQAAEYFRRVLVNSRKGTQLYYQAVWFLNLAHMTLGQYPDGVPQEYRIPATAFQSKVAFPKFPNVADRLGFSNFSTSGGAIAEDMDGDGYADLVLSSWDPTQQLRFLRNNQDGSFVDSTTEAGLDGIVGGLNLLQTDYNNDGFFDVLVLRGGWLQRGGQHPNSLLQNNGDGTFTDVTIRAGLAVTNQPTQTAAWADFNNDGLVDLYIGNEQVACQLFINAGDGTFVDQASSAGVTNGGFTKAVTAGDFDADGHADIYISNLGGANRLYRNMGDGTFRDVAQSAGVVGPDVSFPCWFWDFDNDGHLDIYVSEFSAKTDQIAKSYLGLPIDVPLNRLYRGNGKGEFKDVAVSAGINRPTAPMGSNFGDLDNDGFPDFYLGTGNTNVADVMPNLMYWNRGGKRFEDVTIPGRFGHLQKGHGVVFCDFDHDGDQDVFEQMGGALRGDKYHDAMYRNPGFGNRWIGLSLVGKGHNRAGIGARIKVVVVEKGQQRTIYKHVNSGGSFGANSLRPSIGLGAADRIESLEIFWPASGKTQQVGSVPLDKFLVVVEGDGSVHQISN